MRTPLENSRRLGLTCLLLIAVSMQSAIALADAGGRLLVPQDSQSQEPRGLALSRYFEEKTRALPPSRPALSLDFPLDLGERLVWDLGYVLTSPGRWQGEQWLEFSAVAAGTGGTFAADRTADIESRVRHPRSAGERRFEDGVENFGDLWGVVGVIGGSEAVGFLAGNDDWKRLGIDAGEASAISALLTASLKEVVGRERPNRGDGPFRFRPFSGNASFPSGHSTEAFTLAATISEHFDDQFWIAAPAYGLASLVALARTRGNEHFLSDVFVGAAIGTSTANTLVDLEMDRVRAERKRALRASISPMLIDGVPGFGLRFRF